MRRIVTAIVIGLVAATSLVAQGLDYDVFLKTPINPATTAGFQDVLVSTKAGVSFAYDHEFAPFVSPGIKGWFAFPPVPIVERVVRFDFGARLFSAFRLDGIELQPFGEYNLFTASADSGSHTDHRFALGVEAIVDVIGIEYSVILPGAGIIVEEFGRLPSDLVAIPANLYHRIGLSWHARPR
ncbi:MAG: hypothetical protein ACOCYX_01860 [Spirochaetota bacterium]